MSKFERKVQSSGFEAGEQAPGESGAQERPDFSDLESPRGFAAGEGETPVEAAPQRAQDIFAPVEKEARQKESAVKGGGKKRYYSPGEVMQKKGCIGCGGMLLVLPITAALLVAAIILF